VNAHTVITTKPNDTDCQPASCLLHLPRSQQALQTAPLTPQSTNSTTRSSCGSLWRQQAAGRVGSSSERRAGTAAQPRRSTHAPPLATGRMHVRGSVRKLCEYCSVVRRRGKVRCVCMLFAGGGRLHTHTLHTHPQCLVLHRPLKCSLSPSPSLPTDLRHLQEEPQAQAASVVWHRHRP